ncbi:hypothetical protein [Blastopirellula marina]|uniref:Uncharacterized protein n=1 Tax=Blastopirellula marina TaxID=124 RepID=A0A2S8FX82_9BACT|nr:hypothetical protein [Blastopirellula marina]PQO36680.1 hypothetical protein C5Y98_11855 [Blastopirellula marina]PTL44510.1 hypothetical protein C5Y97_11865 [Blastopirellula marina]
MICRVPTFYFLIGMLCVSLAWGENLVAAVVYLKGDDEPIAGYLESSDNQTIRLRIPASAGEDVHQTIDRSEIELLLQPVTADRLEQLSPDNPKAYREYAEELVEKKSDPDARETATRLFLIAAYLDPQKEGRSALLGMTPLMNDAQGVRQLRAMAYLLGPEHDVSLLGGTSQEEIARGVPLSEEQRSEVIEVLHMLRQSKRVEARQLLQREEIRAAMRQGTNKITPEECLTLSNGTCPGCTPGEIPNYMLQKLVAAEYELSSSGASEAMQTEWGYYLDGNFLQALPVLSLQNGTRFDPQKCLYRDGQWIEP